MNVATDQKRLSYECQIYTLGDGWVTFGVILNPDGTEEPERYETEAEAQAEIDEFLAEVEAEIAAGERGPNEGYDREDFRVARLPKP